MYYKQQAIKIFVIFHKLVNIFQPKNELQWKSHIFYFFGVVAQNIFSKVLF